MVITHTMKHRPKCPLISHLKSFPTSPNGKLALYLREFRCVIHTRKKWNRDITFYLLLILKTYETATFYFTQMSKPPHLFATDSLSPLKIYWAKRSPESHHEKKKHLQKLCKCLIISVDQLGLEQRTSRLWVWEIDVLWFFISCWYSKRTKLQRFTLLKCQSPHTFVPLSRKFFPF